MTITLTSKEFDKAVSLWLEDQGFSTDRYSISTRCIAGRSDGPLGTRLEVQLDPKQEEYIGQAFLEELVPSVFPATKRFGQGHADE